MKLYLKGLNFSAWLRTAKWRTACLFGRDLLRDERVVLVSWRKKLPNPTPSKNVPVTHRTVCWLDHPKKCRIAGRTKWREVLWEGLIFGHFFVFLKLKVYILSSLSTWHLRRGVVIAHQNLWCAVVYTSWESSRPWIRMNTSLMMNVFRFMTDLSSCDVELCGHKLQGKIRSFVWKWIFKYSK